ncbi:hypothetical protein ONE63_000037 [Megalurothrips usitatus]|uniref:Fibronectin type-III domain-containing protein n=1 Tax=Megalurothrips usitatus TaxID=439358 RepID=A0AAV7Y248_9NEOP|nr:hypothetical protein ONE63_000037 [Megalurothrips usitatus]
MMSWFLFESKDGWCKVHEKNIMAAGASSSEGDTVKYWYNGQEYEGVVLKKHHDHEEVNRALTALKKEKSKLPNKMVTTAKTDSLPARRARQAVVGASTSNSTNTTTNNSRKEPARPRMTLEEKKNRQRILDRNKKEAEKRANEKLLLKANKSNTNADPDWQPNSHQESDCDDKALDDDADDDDNSEDFIVADVLANSLAMKTSRTALVCGIRNPPEGNPGSATSASGPSPSKEELKRQNEMLKLKLQLSYGECEIDLAVTVLANQIMRIALTCFLSVADNSEPRPAAKRIFLEVPDKDSLFSSNKKAGKAVHSVNDQGPSSSKNVFQDLDDDSLFSSNQKAGKAVHSVNDQRPSSSKNVFHDLDDDSLFSSNQKDGKEGDRQNNPACSKLVGSLSPPSSNKKEGQDGNDDSKSDLDGDLDEDSLLAHQLYGQRADTTELMSTGIFCKTDVLTSALTNSTNCNHFCRRVMTGVLIPSKIVECTVSRQKWRAGGERAKAPKEPLHQGALKAIVVSEPPRNLRASNVTARSALLEWDLPDFINSDLATFEVVVTPKAATGRGVVRISVEAPEERPGYACTLRDLQPGIDYAVAVRCGWNGSVAEIQLRTADQE